jgi:predicted GNAT family acetyltransferase
MEFKEENERIVLIDDDGLDVGEINWAQAEKILIIDHTFVDPKYRGKGYSQQLVEKIVEKARRDEQEILPLCPIAKKVIEETPEFQDVLRK